MKKIMFITIGLFSFILGGQNIKADELEPKLTCIYENEYSNQSNSIAVNDVKKSSHPITIEMTIGFQEIHIKKYDSATNTEVKDGDDESLRTSYNIINNYSCPKYIKRRAEGIIGAENIEELNTAGSMGIVLELTSTKRNFKNLCYYHSENAQGIETYEGAAVLGTSISKSVYVDLEQGNYYYAKKKYKNGEGISNYKFMASELEDKTTCPQAFQYNMNEDNSEFKPVSIDTQMEGLKIYKYNIDASGNMTSEGSKEILENVKIYTERLNNYSSESNGTCDGKELLTKKEYEACAKIAETKDKNYGAYTNQLNKAKITYEEAVRAGLENTVEVQALKKVMEDTSKWVGKGTDTLKNRLISKNRCIYKSNTEDIYIALERKSSPDLTTKYDLSMYTDSTLTKSEYSLIKNSAFQTYEALCGDPNMDFNAIADTLDCYEMIKYDKREDGKISFLTKQMKDNMDTWDQKFELIGIEYATSEYIDGKFQKDNSYEKMSDIEKNKITTDGFMFSNMCEIGDISDLIDENGSMSCNDFFDSDTIGFIKKAYFFIEIIAVVLTIALSALDYAKIIISDNQDEFKKANKRLIRRIILVVVLFLLPALINLILGLFKIQGFNSDNPLCVNVTEK